MKSVINIIGHLGKDPEVRETQNSHVGRFSVATTENKKNAAGEWEKETTWHNVKVLGDQAKNAGKYLSKGSLVDIEGEIIYGKYTNKEGVEKPDIHILCNRFLILDKREKSDTPQQAEPKPQPEQRPAETANFDTVQDKKVLDVLEPDSDLPF